MIIYKVTNLMDGKIYIGQTVQLLARRWNDHCRGDKQPDGYLHRAIMKYGKENFHIEQIDAAQTLEGLNALEIFYILKFNCIQPNGYNLLSGGDNRHHHPETREKIRNKLKGRKIKNRWDKGRSKPHSEATKEKLSSILKGRPIPNRWNKGNSTPRSDEHKAKIAATMTGVAQPWKYKQVECIETGEKWPSIQHAATALGIKRPTLSVAIKSGSRIRQTGHTYRIV